MASSARSRASSRPRPFSDAYATLDALNALAKAWNASEPLQRLGARLEFTRVDRVGVVLDPVQPFHRGGIGTNAVNGAVLAGLFDLAIGTVGWLTRPDSRSATVTLSMTFLRPTRGDRVRVEAWLLRGGTNLAFACAEIFDEAGELTGRCDGTVAVARGLAQDDEFATQMRGRRAESAARTVRAPRASSPRPGSSRRRSRSPARSPRSRG